MDSISILLLRFECENIWSGVHVVLIKLRSAYYWLRAKRDSKIETKTCEIDACYVNERSPVKRGEQNCELNFRSSKEESVLDSKSDEWTTSPPTLNLISLWLGLDSWTSSFPY